MEQDKTDSIINKIFSILGIFIASFSIIGILFWLLFYSVATANLSFIIPARNWYQDIYWKIESIYAEPRIKYPQYKPVYAVSVQNANNGIYSYNFFGTLNKVDNFDNLIFLNGIDNKTYVFKITQNIIDDQNPILHGELTVNSLTTGYVEITWSDKRTLSQILTDYNASSATPLNNSATTTYLSSDLTRPSLSKNR